MKGRLVQPGGDQPYPSIAIKSIELLKIISSLVDCQEKEPFHAGRAPQAQH
jgi:hypothetical protein